MYINKEAINNLMETANDEGREFVLLDNEWYWSSTQETEFCAWGVGMNDGYAGSFYKYRSPCVRAVSAFHFIY